MAYSMVGCITEMPRTRTFILLLLPLLWIRARRQCAAAANGRSALSVCLQNGIVHSLFVLVFCLCWQNVVISFVHAYEQCTLFAPAANGYKRPQATNAFVQQQQTGLSVPDRTGPHGRTGLPYTILDAALGLRLGECTH